MSKKIPFSIFALLFSIFAFSQNPFELGGEYTRSIGKGYNTARAGVRAETFQNKSSFSAGFLYTLPSNKSYSVAHGFNLYIGYRYAFSNNIKGNSPFLGARVLFGLENFEGKTAANSFMLTPMAEAGYHFVFGKHIFTAPAVGYGYTIKFSKDYNSLNEDEGGRIIPSLSAGYRF